MRSGSAALMHSAILPISRVGRPFPSSRVQVAPPSRETWTALPGPPEVRVQVRIAICHVPAKSVRGLDGSITRSLAPVSSSTKRTCSQVAPPSMVR